MEAVGILGAGRQALETSGYLQERGVPVAFFAEEAPPGYPRDEAEYGSPILLLAQAGATHRELRVVTAVGDPDVRRRLVAAWPGCRYWSIVSERAWVAGDATVGEGSTVCPMAALNRKARVGAHVLVNVGAIVSHDVVVGDYATLAPGCTVGGACTIGEGAYVGLGATIRDHVHVGAGAFVAAGAVVVGDVGHGEQVLGVPARPRGPRG